MKAAEEWTEDDLLTLVKSKRQEAHDLEYKRCAALDKKSDAKKTELSKDVSAFANSSGGTIVYGIVERKHLPVRLDDGYDPTDITREWLESVVMSRVQPRIEGLRIRPVVLSTHAQGRVAYVVCIPESDTAHQAYDRKYYRRYNFQSVPMEDYEVRDRMFRLKVPKLCLEEVISEPGEERPEGNMRYRLMARVHNVGTVSARNYGVELSLPWQFCLLDGACQMDWPEPGVVPENRQPDVVFLLPGDGPLFPGQKKLLREAHIVLNQLNKGAARDATLTARVYADSAPARDYKHKLAKLYGIGMTLDELDRRSRRGQ